MVGNSKFSTTPALQQTHIVPMFFRECSAGANECRIANPSIHEWSVAQIAQFCDYWISDLDLLNSKAEIFKIRVNYILNSELIIHFINRR